MNQLNLKKLAIYYGYPSLVNQANGDVSKAAAIYSGYSHVVFGANLETDGDQLKPRHADHDKTKEIMEKVPDTHFFGYINLGITNAPEPISIEEIQVRIKSWKNMGVEGIFFDAAGFDFGVTRERQNQAFQATHEQELSVFANANKPEDVFGNDATPLNELKVGNPKGLESQLTEGDNYLFESFVISQGIYQEPHFIREKFVKLDEYKKDFNVNTFGISTYKTNSDEKPDLGYIFYCATLANLDGICISDPSYSSSDNHLFIFDPVWPKDFPKHE